MKRTFLLAAVLVLFATTSSGQTLDAGHFVQPYTTPAAALSGMSWWLHPPQAERASLVPSRLLHPSWGVDRALYQIVYQPVIGESPDCLRVETSSPMPTLCVSIQTGGTGRKCLAPTWSIKTYSTAAEARAGYASLDPLQQSTAYLLATVATNSPYIVLHQDLYLMSAQMP